MIRSALKASVKAVVRSVVGGGAPEPAATPPVRPARPAPGTQAPLRAEAAAEVPQAAPERAPSPAAAAELGAPKAEPAAQPVAAPAVEVVEVAAAAADPVEALLQSTTDDEVGPPLSAAAVQVVLDEFVRPALQADGGDITLIKVESNDVYVKLVGSCSTCPSSIMTMKMGVEALFREEFPQMRELVQVD